MLEKGDKDIFCDSLRKYLRSEISLDEFNLHVDKFKNKRFLEHELVVDIYHAVQHFELDEYERVCDPDFDQIERSKLLEVIEAFDKEGVTLVGCLLDEFFNLERPCK